MIPKSVFVDPALVKHAKVRKGKKYQIMGACVPQGEEGIDTNYTQDNIIYQIKDDSGEIIGLFACTCVPAEL
ncbi:hypothetical protein QA601_13415 [Chitinispirillales bacterium ANBcel5]|uniref:hypothetical protein n=1 Tax=Cellulosispirillum alkaliphilum TaxID=3039283 RepID=UPI002A594B93|nr:hypothetical protein [Chitinispirillales bacterium ANBcel5]